jgi:RNA polymerase sigma factor (sigma-70 family)
MTELELNKLISDCLSSNRQAQFRLYEVFAPKLLPLCKRYAKNEWDAEDILQEGFIKAFRYLHDFRNNGSFEGWMRRIMVTSALNFYKRKKIIYNETELNHSPDFEIPEMVVTTGIFQEELLKMVNDLPNGYKNVFCLNTIEGYSHKEIGEMLNITVNTSKSQLTRARVSLQRKYNKLSDYNSNKPNILQSA